MSRRGMDNTYPDSKVHGANLGPIWGRQDELCHLGKYLYDFISHDVFWLSIVVLYCFFEQIINHCYTNSVDIQVEVLGTCYFGASFARCCCIFIYDPQLYRNAPIQKPTLACQRQVATWHLSLAKLTKIF